MLICTDVNHLYGNGEPMLHELVVSEVRDDVIW